MILWCESKWVFTFGGECMNREKNPHKFGNQRFSESNNEGYLKGGKRG
jgi:hypothetical protein